MEEVELSVGLLPDDHNKYIVVDYSTGKELLINGGVTLKAIDENGEVHKLGSILSADYFFKLITNALDEDHKKFFRDKHQSWGVGSRFSSEEMKKADEVIINKLKNGMD